MADANKREECLCRACSSTRPLQECIVYSMGILGIFRRRLHLQGCHLLLLLWIHCQPLQCRPWPYLVRLHPPTSLSWTLDSERWKPAWQTTPITKKPLPGGVQPKNPRHQLPSCGGWMLHSGSSFQLGRLSYSRKYVRVCSATIIWTYYDYWWQSYYSHSA